jgi:hypothetical protein
MTVVFCNTLWGGGGAEREKVRVNYNSFRPAQPGRPSIRGPSPQSCILARIISSSVNPSNLGFSPSPTPPRLLPAYLPSLPNHFLWKLDPAFSPNPVPNRVPPPSLAENAPSDRPSFFSTNHSDAMTVIELHSRTCGLCDPLIKYPVCFWSHAAKRQKTNGGRLHLPTIAPLRHMYKRDARKDLLILASPRCDTMTSLSATVLHHN